MEKTSKATDPRFDRTESDLMEAFQILTRKKDPEKITVQEITKLAGVTRTTFYNHYVDMPSLTDAVETQLLREIFTMMRSFHPEGNDEICRIFFRSLCGFIQQNSFLARMLATPRANAFIERALSMFQHYVRSTLEESPRSAEEQQAVTYAISYAIGGVVGVLHGWALSKCAQPPEAVAGFLTRLFLDGMRPYLREG